MPIPRVFFPLRPHIHTYTHSHTHTLGAQWVIYVRRILSPRLLLQVRPLEIFRVDHQQLLLSSLLSTLAVKVRKTASNKFEDAVNLLRSSKIGQS